MDMRVGSYPSIYAVGHRAIEGIFKDEVLIEEKIDGSQFSFMKVDHELYCRSKRKQLIIEAPEKLFNKAVEVVQELGPTLQNNWVYRGEYLQKPKHNTLAYNRTPKNNIILFDVMVALESYLSREQKEKEAERIGLETVPIIFQGKIDDVESLLALLDHESILGGVNIEGMVIKNYNLFTSEKKIALAKYVSEKYKEQSGATHMKSPKAEIIQSLITRYKTEARWEKAVQHLRDDGELLNEPKDIGSLIKEVVTDVGKECEDEIKEQLFAHFWPNIRRGITAGLPEWYKEKIAVSAFE